MKFFIYIYISIFLYLKCVSVVFYAYWNDNVCMFEARLD